MIVVTGAAGFIGSCLLKRLNADRFFDLIAVDDFSNPEKLKNLEQIQLAGIVHRDNLANWLDTYHERVQFIFHLGARTDTTEFNWEILEKLNLDYSKMLWNASVKYAFPIVYASSAATYGNGEFGYDDRHEDMAKLQPLNPYGKSKLEFDLWALKQEKKPFFWIGLKFFNVYGPNENHKGRMASVIYHAFHQIKKTGGMKLFKSHNPNFKDGEQLRDFIYVKDLLEVLMFFMLNRNQENNGIYNLGTGSARSFYDLVDNTFKGMGLDANISFIDMPEDIRDKYQYYTQAEMQKLRKAGYDKPFTSLEDGVQDYVANYLEKNRGY